MSFSVVMDLFISCFGAVAIAWNRLALGCPAEICREVSKLSGAQCKPPSASLSSQGPLRGLLYEYERVSNMPGSNYHPAVTLNDDIYKGRSPFACAHVFVLSIRQMCLSTQQLFSRPTFCQPVLLHVIWTGMYNVASGRISRQIVVPALVTLIPVS